jgi:hypothetical protein
MTLVSQIVYDAARESDLIALGQTQEAVAAVEGLRLLNRVVASTLGNEVGENLTDWVLSDEIPYVDYVWWAYEWLPGNIRIITANQTAQTRRLTPYPQNGQRIQIVDTAGDLSTYPVTLQPGAFKFNGSASDYVANTDGLNATWMFRADLGDWVRVLPLESADEFPFPEAYDDAFVTMLATRLNPRYNQALSEESRAAMRRAIGQLKAAYSNTQNVPVDPALLRLSQNMYGYGGGPMTTALFLRGIG